MLTTPKGFLCAIAALMTAVALSACQSAPGARPSPSPPRVVALANHNTRLGNSRTAAELGAAVGRYLYPRVSYWEVAVVTTPPAGTPADPLDQASLQQAGASVRQVRVVIATEEADGIKSFRAGGHAHEREIALAVAHLEASYFTQATSYEVDVYYGEADLHAIATLKGATFTYQVHDTL